MRCFGLFVISFVALPLASAGDHPASGQKAEGSDGVWEVQAGGVFVRLAQISPDQVRAFYLARGFDDKSVEHIASACVFQTVLRNDSAQPISFRLIDWYARSEDGSVAPKLDEAWQQEWSARSVATHARTAFRWALFPSQQHYQPGDWNMGMTTYDLRQGVRFDLHVVWQVANMKKQLTVPGVVCAKNNEAVEDRQ